MTDLESQLLFAQDQFPLLAPHIEILMLQARASYKKAGEPDGPGDRRAYHWFMRGYEKWLLKKKDQQQQEKLLTSILKTH